MQRQEGIIHFPHNKYTLNVPGILMWEITQPRVTKTKQNKKLITVLLQTLMIAVLISTVRFLPS